MEKEKFIKLMKEYNYTDEEIEEFIQLAEECRAMGMEIDYKDIVLEKKEE